MNKDLKIVFNERQDLPISLEKVDDNKILPCTRLLIAF